MSHATLVKWQQLWQRCKVSQLKKLLPMHLKMPFSFSDCLCIS